MVIQQFDESLSDEWDKFVSNTSAATLLHTRRFLSYHESRFEDYSLIARDGKGHIVAVFPAALSLSDNSIVVSHPGATYGGILGGGKCRGEVMFRLLQKICEHYKKRGLLKLQYKAVPFIYYNMPVQDDLYALFLLDAVRYRCDLSATVDLSHRGTIGSRRKRGYKKAVKSGVIIASGVQYASGLWDVLHANLKDKYDVNPVHTLDEVLLLHERFPEQIKFVVALNEGKVEAGVVLFQSSMVSHAQYITSSVTGYAVNALDMVFEHCIAEAKDLRVRYFDFGISNEDAGRVLNEGLYGFKAEFGAGGVVHEFYELDLEALNAT
ncbi:MAG: hypothetical protein ACJAS1_002306 [Oleiphilaceae bacterium]|jgi:hypothetical protein